MKQIRRPGSRRHWLFLAATLLLGACDQASEGEALVGYIEADWAYIAAPVSGWIVELPARRGSEVTPGELLFALDSTEAEAQLAQAQARAAQAQAEIENLSTGARAPEIRALNARVEEARANLARAAAERKRILPLVDRGVEPDTRGDLVRANYQVAVAALKAAEENVAVARQRARPAALEAAAATLNNARGAVAAAAYRFEQHRIAARTSGTVIDRLYEVGEFVTPGTPVLTLMPNDALHVRFFVSQKLRPALEVGQAVRISADGLPAPLSATIRYIADTVEFTPPQLYVESVRDKFVFEVEATLPAGSPLLAGLPVDVSLTR